MHFLVTGGTGYTGSRFIHKILSECPETNVHILIREQSDIALIESLIENLTVHYYHNDKESIDEIFRSHNIDAVFHFAAYSKKITDNEQHNDLMLTNIVMTSYILEAMKTSECRTFLCAGSYWQYFFGTEEVMPNSIYAATKSSLKSLFQYYSHFQSYKIAEIILYDSYGPKDPRNKIFKIIDNSYAKKQSVKMSPGNQFLYMVHIDDVVNAFLVAYKQVVKISNGKYVIWFAANREARRLKDIVALYLKEKSYDDFILWGATPYPEGQIMQPYVGDRIPGWQCNIELEEGLQDSL